MARISVGKGYTMSKVLPEHGDVGHLAIRVFLTEKVAGERGYYVQDDDITFTWQCNMRASDNQGNEPYWYGMRCEMSAHGPKVLQVAASLYAGILGGQYSGFFCKPDRALEYLHEKGYQEVQHHRGLYEFFDQEHYPEGPTWACTFRNERQHQNHVIAEDEKDAFRLFRNYAAKQIDHGRDVEKWADWLKEPVFFKYQEAETWVENTTAIKEKTDQDVA
jgi:hypothetical protein